MGKYRGRNKKLNQMKSDKIISLTGRIDAVDESSVIIDGGGGDTSGVSGGSSSVATTPANAYDNEIIEDSNVYCSKSFSELEPNVVIQGWMLKLNRNNNWQDRYFVFQSDQVLSYYHKPKIQTEDVGIKEKGNDVASGTETIITKIKQPTATFKISRQAGCEIGDLYVEQRNTSLSASVSTLPSSSSCSSGKESLYCINITWTVNADTVVSHSKSTMVLSNNESFNNR